MVVVKTKEIGECTLKLTKTMNKFEMHLSKGKEPIFSLPFTEHKNVAEIEKLDHYYDSPKTFGEKRKRSKELMILHDFMEEVMQEKGLVVRGSTTAANARALKKRGWRVRLNNIKTVGEFEKNFRRRK